jgi:glycosyltransferase involved in cell wall biosynthesis
VKEFRQRIKLVVVLEATLGGTRKFASDLLLGLDKEKFDITFIYSTDRADEIFFYDLQTIRARGIAVIEIPMKRAVALFADLSALAALTRALRRIQPDIVYLNAAKAGALGRIAGKIAGVKKCYYNPHGGSFHKFQNLSGSVYLFVEKFLSHWTYRFIGVSKQSCRQIAETLNVKPAHVLLVYNGIRQIDVSSKNAAAGVDGIPTTLKIPEETLVVLYPALFLEAKGHLPFIESLAAYQPGRKNKFVVICAGGGPLLEEAMRRVNELGIQQYFRFINFQKNLDPYFRLCDIVVLPSLSEAFPYVLLEAMMYSKPIIATNVGGIPELVIEGDNGHIVEPNNLLPLFGYLDEYSGRKSDLRTMGARGNKYLHEKYLLDDMIKKYEEIFCE